MKRTKIIAVAIIVAMCFGSSVGCNPIVDSGKTNFNVDGIAGIKAADTNENNEDTATDTATDAEITTEETFTDEISDVETPNNQANVTTNKANATTKTVGNNAKPTTRTSMYTSIYTYTTTAAMRITTTTRNSTQDKAVNKNYGMANSVIDLVNQERAKAGLNPVSKHSGLMNTAMLRASEVIEKAEHTRPNGTKCYTAFPSGFLCMGENIAYGQMSANSVMNAWMNSPTHRANILDADFTAIGVGCVEYNGTYYWAQCFGGNGTN